MANETTPDSDYLAGGFFVSKYIGATDCTGIELQRVTLAADHSPRAFFPASWALDWVDDSEEDRLEAATALGFTAESVPSIVNWATAAFGREFGWTNVCFSLPFARHVRATFFPTDADVEIWGLGLHRSIADRFLEDNGPPAPVPGFAPTGSGGIYEMLANGRGNLPLGKALGHEMLTYAVSALNSLDSFHFDEHELLQKAGVTLNEHGLIADFESAHEFSKTLPRMTNSEPPWECMYLPWLIVRYE